MFKFLSYSLFVRLYYVIAVVLGLSLWPFLKHIIRATLPTIALLSDVTQGPCVTSESNAIVGEIKMPDNAHRRVIMPCFDCCRPVWITNAEKLCSMQCLLAENINKPYLSLEKMLSFFSFFSQNKPIIWSAVLLWLTTASLLNYRRPIKGRVLVC